MLTSHMHALKETSPNAEGVLNIGATANADSYLSDHHGTADIKLIYSNTKLLNITIIPPGKRHINPSQAYLSCCATTGFVSRTGTCTGTGWIGIIGIT